MLMLMMITGSRLRDCVEMSPRSRRAAGVRAHRNKVAIFIAYRRQSAREGGNASICRMPAAAAGGHQAACGAICASDDRRRRRRIFPRPRRHYDRYYERVRFVRRHHTAI